MLKHYIKISLRNLLRDKTASLVSVLGLAVGMAFCILILIYIENELSYNDFNTNITNIYRLNWTVKDHAQVSAQATTPIPLSQSLKSEIPGIQRLAKLAQVSGQMQYEHNRYGGDRKRFQEQNVCFADQDIFKIFSIKFLAGDPNTALSNIGTVVMTDEMAAKYFGSADPVGKSLLFDDKVLLQVVGVVKKMPSNSDIKFDCLVSFETIYKTETPAFADFLKNDWTFTPVTTWLLLKPEENPAHVTQLIAEHLHLAGTDRNRTMNGVNLQPLKDIHLYAADVDGNPSTSNIKYIYIFGNIAFLILLIANVNFINLSVARSIDRVREIGMRKVLGANKQMLQLQTLSETIITSLHALLIGFLLAECTLPLLNRLTGKQLTVFNWISVSTVVPIISGFLITGILAGIYPAFFITRFKTIPALKGRAGERLKHNITQKILIVTQFSISIVLIISTIIILRQVSYLRNKPLGFQKQQMLVVPIFGSGGYSFGQQIDSGMRRKINTFYDELNRHSKVKSVSAASQMPGQGFVRGLVIPQGGSERENIFTPWLSVDYNFLSTMDMQLVAGRNFSKNTGSDHLNAFIVNESAVRAYGWLTPQNALGKTFIRGKLADGKKGQIIGVVKDFNFNSLNDPTEPLVIDVNPPRFTQLAIRIQPDHMNETIAYVKKTWDKLFPDRQFGYSFLDKDIDAQYNDKERFSQVIEYFAAAAILLSCSGLFSLAFIIALKRNKEISIRKVLGATTPSITLMLSADFLKMVVISSLIASPVAWCLMHNWLKNYPYRINMDPWTFLFAALFVLLITLITISLQTVRAAIANPIKNLRME
ncbi:MAG TPA: ABC transporter permease [Mucilaginibacter sp.]|nr:ABC transporter permease [Mucilaginibacter sp.]